MAAYDKRALHTTSEHRPAETGLIDDVAMLLEAVGDISGRPRIILDEQYFHSCTPIHFGFESSPARGARPQPTLSARGGGAAATSLAPGQQPAEDQRNPECDGQDALRLDDRLLANDKAGERTCREPTLSRVTALTTTR